MPEVLGDANDRNAAPGEDPGGLQAGDRIKTDNNRRSARGS